MDNSRTITIDNYQINSKTIDKAFRNAKQQNKTKGVLGQTFRLMNLYQLYQNNPSDSSIKQSIKIIVNSQFIPNNREDNQPRIQFDLSQAFPLNKLGNFGRTLERKCKLLPKGGVMEFQDQKQQPKFKQIKTFKNKIEMSGDSQNDNKIGWYSDQKKFPFRIVLIDKNEGHRGLYFSTKQKAEKIRLVLTQIYNYQGDFSNLIGKLAANHQLQVHGKFKNKLVARNKMLNASIRYSRKITFQNIKKNEELEPQIARNDVNTSIFNHSNKKIEDEYQRKKTSEMIVVSGLLNTKSDPQTQQNFKQINRQYLNNMFKVWLLKARKAEYMNKQQSSPQNQISDNSTLIKSKINPTEIEKDKKNKFNDLFSKNKLDISNLSVSKGKKQLEFVDFAQSSLKERNKSLKNSVFREDQSFIKQIDRSFNSQQEEIFFYRITFPTLKNLFFKPIVTLELLRKNYVQKSTLFNTIIAKKQPELIYELLRDKNQYPLTYGSNLKQYEINVKVIDFLSNEQVISDKITLKNKILTKKSIIQSDNKLIQLQAEVQKTMKETGYQNQDNQDTFNKIELQIPPLTEACKDKIYQFWQKESQSQGYYNQTDMSIYRILSLIQSAPLTWWKDLSQDEYELLHIVNAASKIFGFKMIRSFSHLTKVFAKIYTDLNVLTQKLLSFIQTFLKVYYFPEYFNKIQKFHKVLGLDQDCEFMSKINLEILVIRKVIELQFPALIDKLDRKNIKFGYVMIEYIYQAFSRNFSVNNLKQLWNFLYKDLQYLQLNMALIVISLIKNYEEDLLKVKRLKQFCRILQSKKVNRLANILNQLQVYKEKYFGKAKGFLDEIKNIFNSQPLQPVIYQFYKKQTAKLDKRKRIKYFQKKSSLTKVNRQIQIQFPEYQSKKYTLHIFFTKVPEVGGSLSLKSGEVQYECLNHQKKRYFIISEVSNRVYLNFFDLKSNQFSCELIFNQGIHQNSCQLRSQKAIGTHRITYIAGLLTDNQIEIIKKGRKFQHFVSPFVKQIQMLQQMNRSISETYFLRKYDNHTSKDDLIKKIKTLFCSGSKVFNQIEFYIEQIQTSELTIEQKINFTLMLAKKFSEEFCLCNNHIFEKHFIRHFLESTGYEMTPHQFECFYGDSFEYEFDSAKILKCRFIPLQQLNKQLKLQLPVLEYFVNKSISYMYSDILVDDLVHAVTPVINQQLQGLYQGELKLFYSSGGQIFMKSWQLKLKNKNKQYFHQQILQDNGAEVQENQNVEPELLMSQILPSFAKISTILDYVNNNRQVDLKSKYQDKDRKKIAEQINLLKESQIRFKRVIMMRYHQPPQKLYFPFFDYYYELTHDSSTPLFKNMFLNNLKTDLKSLCLFKGHLKYGQNSKIQSYTYRQQLGLFGNLRMMSKDAKGWFFFGLVKDENQGLKNNARIFVNYGYGVFRWQNCLVLGYVLRKKQNKSQKSSVQNKLRKQYLVRVRNQQKYVKDYELEISPQILSKIQKINEGNDRPLRYERSNYEQNQQEKKNSQLKYLSKFMK